jgi:transcriptional regulator with XRE-family HTH domain
MADNSVIKIFCEHLEKFLYEEHTYKKTADKLRISESCLKSWLTGERIPSIRSLDKVANHIGCFSYQLIKKQYPLEYGNDCHNNSHTLLRKNLEALFIEHQCFSLPQKLSLLQNQISDFMLISYLRTKNYRLPSLQNLNIMAQALGVETYKLLFWED